MNNSKVRSKSRSRANLVCRNGWWTFRCAVDGREKWISLGTQDETMARAAAEAVRRTIEAERLRIRLERAGIHADVGGNYALLERLNMLRMRSDTAKLGELEAAWRADAQGRELKDRTVDNYWTSLKLILRTVHGDGADVDALKCDVIDRELAHDYEAAVIAAAKGQGPDALERAKTTAASTWNQARSIFAQEALEGREVRQLKLPDFSSFRTFSPKGSTRRIRRPVDDATLSRLADGAADLWFNAPARWLALALCGNLGLRRGSACAARWDWVRRVNGQWRLYLLATDEAAPKGNEYFVTIPADLWGDMCEVRQAGDYIVPGADAAARNRVFDENVQWLRSLGLDVDKPNHELRAIYAQAMKRQHGAEAAQEALGHGDGRTTRIYTGNGSEKTVRPL